jgi:hypothetical protein
VGETAVIGYFQQQPPPVEEGLRLIDYIRCGSVLCYTVILNSVMSFRTELCTAGCCWLRLLSAPAAVWHDVIH